MLRTRCWSYATLLLLTACTGTRTGNPALPEGGDFIRSSLKRELHPDVSGETSAQLGADNRAFAFDLYAQLAGTQDGNTLISPYSLSLALAMTYAGAEGETESEMASALHFALPEPELHAAFNATDLALAGRADEVQEGAQPGDGFMLALTNAAFVQTGDKPRKPYLDVLARNYDAGLYALDFQAEPEPSRVAINDWVAERTEDRIEDLLPAGAIDENTRLVLTNAVYFKAAWLRTLDPKLTKDGAFAAPDGEVTIPMMHGAQSAQYGEGDGYQAFELPYVSSAVRMLFILPDAERFAEIEQGLDDAWLDALREGLEERAVTFTLPRFSFGADFELGDALKALGMRAAFSGAADFSDMLEDSDDLYIKTVLHQTFIAIDEQGTEAAASTALIFDRLSISSPAEIVLNRPFMFAIYDEPTGQILFLGRVVDPSAD